MPPKNPLGKIKDAATGTIKDPLGTASKAVSQARGGVEIGKAVAGQVAKSAAGVVVSRVPGRKASTPGPIGPPPGGELRAVPDEKPAPVTKAPAKKAPAKKAPAKKAPAEQAPAKKAPAEQAPAKKTPAKKAPAKKTAVTTPPVTDVATPLVKEQAASQPVPAAEPAPENPIDAGADSSQVDVTPADVARKAATKKPAAKKTVKKAPAKETAAKKTAATKSTPSGQLPPPRKAD